MNLLRINLNRQQKGENQIRTEPCGTTQMIGLYVDEVLPIDTY